jgi:Ni,Fe-hydrogenase maturation factor
MDRLDQLPGGPPGSLTAQRADIVVFACGDPAHAEHDSVAIAACKGLPAAVLERIDLKITGPMRPEYLRDLAPGTFAIIADTVSGAAGTAGEVIEVPFPELAGRELPLLASSTPDQPLDEVVAMADLLRDEPVRGTFVGLGMELVDLGAPPDDVAVRQLRDVVARALPAAES